MRRVRLPFFNGYRKLCRFLNETFSSRIGLTGFAANESCGCLLYDEQLETPSRLRHKPADKTPPTGIGISSKPQRK